MSGINNPYFGRWEVNWDDEREVAEAMGTGFRRERRTSTESSILDCAKEFGMHIEKIDIEDENW